jgi:hypothetical protein
VRKNGEESGQYRHGFALKPKGSIDYKLYQAWLGLRRRCLEKSNKRYGGRGIRFCKRWDKFENFLKDMGNSFYEHIKNNESTSLDRINGNRHYSPKNCRWATNKEQNFNRRYNFPVTHKGKTKKIFDWWKELCVGVPYRIFRRRLFEKGWSLEDALNTPLEYRGLAKTLYLKKSG